MELIVNRPVKVNVNYISFRIPARIDSMEFNMDDIERIKRNFGCKDTDDFTDDTNEVILSATVEIDTGRVMNWEPISEEFDIYEKVVDEGFYALYDTIDNEFASYEGYVPDFFECNEEGYGDYFNFTVSPNGFIKNWNFDLNRKLTQFMNNVNE